MLAGDASDVRICALTWEPSVTVFMFKLDAAAAGRPAGTGHARLVAALCAQYVPKFLPPHLPALGLAMAGGLVGRPWRRTHLRRPALETALPHQGLTI